MTPRNLLCLAVISAVAASPRVAPAQGDAKPAPGGIQLLPGYVHEPKQGFDSIVGVIGKKDGLTIMYEIGRVRQPGQFAIGGDFSDRAKLLPEPQRQWYKEQMIGGQPVHMAYGKDQVLYASYPKSGVNFSVRVASPEEMAEALLIILSYPNEVKKAGEGE